MLEATEEPEAEATDDAELTLELAPVGWTLRK